MASQDYSKMKNADLEALLKERNLPGGGKKADMVARLQQADATNAPAQSTEATTTTTAPASGKPAQASTETTQAATATDKTADAPAPKVDDTAAVEGEAKADDKAADGEEKKKLTKEERQALQEQKKAEREAQREADEKKYSSGINTTNLRAEIEQRKKRAERWGMDAQAEEAIKKLERALKFETGTQETPDGEKRVIGLDTALPSEREKKKRGRGDDDGGRGGKRQNRGGRGGGGQSRAGGGRGGHSGPRPAANNRPSSGFSEQDRLAAERRKQRFAGTA